MKPKKRSRYCCSGISPIFRCHWRGRMTNYPTLFRHFWEATPKSMCVNVAGFCEISQHVACQTLMCPMTDKGWKRATIRKVPSPSPGRTATSLTCQPKKQPNSKKANHGLLRPFLTLLLGANKTKPDHPRNCTAENTTNRSKFTTR